MRKARKFAAIAAAAMMTAALALPMSMSSFATEGDELTDDTTVTDSVIGAKTIVIENADDASHTYVAYQVFKGDVSNKTTLANITSGDDVNMAGLLSTLKNSSLENYFDGIDDFDDTKTSATDIAAENDRIAKAIANVLATEKDGDTLIFDYDNGAMQEFAKAVGKNLTGSGVESSTVGSEQQIGVPADGYYLIQDKDAPTNGDGAMTRFIIQVVGSAKVTAKTDSPSVEKKVVENVKWATDDKYSSDKETPANSVYSESTGALNDVADYCVGDTVPFELIGKLPSTYDDYTKYYYQFNDKLGREFNYTHTTNTTKNFTVVAVNKNAAGESVESVITSQFTGADVAAPQDDTSEATRFSITCDDLKAIKTDDEGKSLTITKDTIIVVRYNAVLNDKAVVGRPGQENEVYLTYSCNPNYTGEGDKDKQPDKHKDTKEDKVIVFTYELDETKIDAASANATEKVTLNGAEFILSRTKTVKGEDGAPDTTVTEYATLARGSYDEDAKTWTATTETDETKITDTTWIVQDWNATKAEAEANPIKSSNGGKFNIRGLDDGEYQLTETKAPEGYNLPAQPFTVVLAAKTENGQGWTTEDPADALKDYSENDKTGWATNKLAVAANTGVASSDIGNSKAGSLPSTGGIGTTLFYVVGGVLVAGAGVTLITKKRLGDSEK
ncbi:MAG: LPXTG cell wall anchor domain-containing protein [Oscillospiraceae bacterium]|nr:LPXTG cell wall anchor domain-containing protein [Oscillospiraceae bacterium]